MIVRHACREDLPAIEHLYTERAALLAESDPRLKQIAARAWLDQTPPLTWVGELDGRLMGYIAALQHVNPPVVLVDSMALDVHQNVRGLASLLLLAVREWTVAAKIERIIVLVPRFSPVEQAFWRAQQASLAPDFTPPTGYDGLQIPA